MRILWVSSIAWKEQGEYPYQVNGPGAVSGSLFQQALIEELEKMGHNVDIVSDYPYAKGSNIHHKLEWKHGDKSNDVAVKTIDIPYYSLLYKAKNLKKEVEEKIKKQTYDVAIAYLMHQPFLDAIAFAKKKDQNIKTILICPDLPDMMDMSLEQKKIKKLLKSIDMRRIKKLCNKMDGFVLFTEEMKEKIFVKEMNYTVIEGIANIEDLNPTFVEKENFIMYAGTLHKNIGVENIIEAINYIDDNNIKLKIYGTGELEGFVKEKARENHRIIYGGFIDRISLFEEQKKAIALINARNPEDDYTNYSFPSKTFEYLYSGTPFITTKLNGVPKEYREFLFELENNKPETIAMEVEKIINQKEEVETVGLRAREFVRERKNRCIQTKKFTEFLYQILS